MGCTAWKSWTMYERAYPEVDDQLLAEPIRTYHTSTQAYFCPAPQRAGRIAKHREDFAAAARLIDLPTPDRRRARRALWH